jgi:hypothetical protein
MASSDGSHARYLPRNQVPSGRASSFKLRISNPFDASLLLELGEYPKDQLARPLVRYGRAYSLRVYLSRAR